LKPESEFVTRSVLENARVRAIVDPKRGALLASLTIDGHEVLTEDGSFVMVPWAGRIRDGLFAVDGVTHQLPVGDDGNAIHGLGRDAAWDAVDANTFQCEIGAPWPTKGVARLHYEMLPDGLRTTLTWEDGTDLPCSIGLHPSFRRRLDTGGELVLTLLADQMVERGDDLLPTGRLVPPQPPPWDDCFRVTGSPVLTWPGALAVTLSSSTAWWVVYDKPADAICVEPQSAPPDAFAHGALRPDKPWPRTLWFEIRAPLQE